MGRTQVTANSACSERRTLPQQILNYLLITTCLVLVFVSNSPAAGCTPSYFGEDLNADKASTKHIIIIEGSSFRMSCHLNKFDHVKWTLNGREIDHRYGKQLDVVVNTTEKRHGGDIHTEIIVSNASKQHSGEYKCSSPCHQGQKGSNNGTRLVVIFGENPTVNGKVMQKISPAGSSEKPLEVLVRDAVPGTKREVITCNATNVKSIIWVKGSSAKDKNNVMIPRCAESKESRKADEPESEVELERELDAPCTREEVTEEVTGSGGVRVRKVQLNLTFELVRKEDFGPYTCITVPLDAPKDLEPFGTTIYFQENSLRFKRSSSSSSESGSSNSSEVFSIKRLTVQGKPFDKGHRSVTVNAGNTLSIHCNITGANISDVSVTWSKDGQPLSMQDDKVLKHSDLWFDYLEAEAKHRGHYKCSAKRKNGGDEKPEEYEFYVRIKDKLMPLWPFLGICMEVAVLCIIIVCYEKRRNKTELEESDTDGSPDQCPDQ